MACGGCFGFLRRVPRLSLPRWGLPRSDFTGGVRVSYVTDVEGDLSYFRRYVGKSSVLLLTEDGRLSFRNPATDYFVFGGGATDRGPGDLRLLQMLVDFKRRHPDRVHLVLGNRDLNKIRLVAELDEKEISRPCEEIQGAWWIPEQEQAKKRMSLAAWFADRGLPNTRVTRLKWMFDATLGCPKTFEFRKEEIAALGNVDASSVSDEAVVQSFLDTLAPGGLLAEYYRLGTLAVCLGNTLFVHGAADPRAVGFVPDHGTRFARHSVAGHKDVWPTQQWAEELNAWKDQQLHRWHHEPLFDSDRRRGGEGLPAYQSHAAMQGRTVVGTSYCDGGNMPHPDICGKAMTKGTGQVIDVTDPSSKSVVQHLNSSRIFRVIVGHKPSGDSPAIKRCAEYGACPKGLEVVSADTSYSDEQAADKRGQAVSEVALVGKSLHENALRLHGTLADGRTYDFRLPTLGASCWPCTGRGNSFVGRMNSEGWWVKARLGSSGAYLLSKGSGRNVLYRTEGVTILKRMRWVEP